MDLSNGKQIQSLRQTLGLSQVQFAQLFGVHFMTVSKWERDVLAPSPYQLALLQQFAQTAAAKQEQAAKEVKNLLIGAGVVAALIFLLSASNK
jgi:transcriptional regulator with XRE-family HTH domain